MLSSFRSWLREIWSSWGCPWLWAPISIPAAASSRIWLHDSIGPSAVPAACLPASAIQPVVTKTVAVKPNLSSTGRAWLWKSA